MIFWRQTLKSDPKKLWETLKKFDYPKKGPEENLESLDFTIL